MPVHIWKLCYQHKRPPPPRRTAGRYAAVRAARQVAGSRRWCSGGGGARAARAAPHARGAYARSRRRARAAARVRSIYEKKLRNQFCYIYRDLYETHIHIHVHICYMLCSVMFSTHIWYIYICPLYILRRCHVVKHELLYPFHAIYHPIIWYIKSPYIVPYCYCYIICSYEICYIMLWHIYVRSSSPVIYANAPNY